MSEIPIDKESLLSALKELEFLVVSLDHIGSAELSTEVRANTVYRFVVDGDVFQRLSSIRRVLASTLDEAVSPTERDAIDDALGSVFPWDHRSTG